MCEWNYNVDEAPTDGTEFLADDGFKTFTVVYHKHKNPYSNGLFARSSCGCKIDIGMYRPEYDHMFFQKWMNLPK